MQAVWKEEFANTVWDLWFNTLGYKLGTILLRKWIMHKRKMAKLGQPQRGLTFETCVILLLATTVGFSTLAFSGLMTGPK
jgi:glycopeptide antibiotics resistance protein